MIFQRRAKKYDCNFYIGNEKIDIVQSYTYVGTQISSTGNFTLSLEHLREKAVHALFSLRRHIDFSSLKPSLACKSFDTMISPILTYNSEVWCLYQIRLQILGQITGRLKKVTYSFVNVICK